MKHRKSILHRSLLMISGLALLTNYCSAQITSAGVFVLGGIHKSHENAKYYTYERLGEIYQQLKPDILCVETKQKYVDDKSFKETPFDFKKFIIPLAQKDKTIIYGIDWWDDEKGKKWGELQQKAFKDTTLSPEMNLVGGMFSLFNEYFVNRDFEDINSEYITSLWRAKNELKYHIFSQHQEYMFITEFENERNTHIVENILRIIEDNPTKKILVAIGIDHKYYIETELEKHGIKVYQITNIKQFEK